MSNSFAQQPGTASADRAQGSARIRGAGRGTEGNGGAPQHERSIGLGGAIGIGVGAIVGGGILALAGAAFRVTGPSALVAFGLNGLVAILTALSFAEMSTAFPQSGGAYTFAKKVLTVEAAFGVGWILWFAYIVAAVLYAMGFAEYGAAIALDLWPAGSPAPPAWLTSRGLADVLAIGAVLVYSFGLVRRAPGGGQWATWAKVAVFVVLIAAGWVLLPMAPSGTVLHGIKPFFTGGATGLLQAMGFTFIALQGFEVIAAVAGEVKTPRRVIPRAMMYSLAIALGIYLPLLFLTSTLGTRGSAGIAQLATENPETVMAVAVRNYLGLPGYWLVMVAAVLSMLSALQANLLAASRIALSMARERTLPSVLAVLHAERGTPVMAVVATALAVLSLLFMIPDLAAAGAAASLIFLVSFALAHLMAVLARRRGGAAGDAFRTPAFPVIPVAGGLGCAGLALFQAVAVPSAGAVTAIWLGLGALFYLAVFRSRAEVVDALAEAHDPHLARLRGRAPLVLVPVANPDRAAALVALANALAPPVVGRVLLLSVVKRPEHVEDGPPPQLIEGEKVLHEALTESLSNGASPEALLTIAADPWTDICRVAQTHRCESIVLGLSDLDARGPMDRLESLINDVASDAAILWAPPGFRLQQVNRILIPVGGKGGHDELRARVLGSLCRTGERDVTFVQFLPSAMDSSRHAEVLNRLRKLAQEETPNHPHAEILVSDDAVHGITERARDADLLVLGLARKQGRRTFGRVGLEIVRRSPCATLLISRR